MTDTYAEEPTGPPPADQDEDPEDRLEGVEGEGQPPAEGLDQDGQNPEEDV
jgi:hypothetical protein